MSEEELMVFKSRLKLALTKRIEEALARDDVPTFVLNMKLFGKLFGGEMDKSATSKVYYETVRPF